MNLPQVGFSLTMNRSGKRFLYSHRNGLNLHTTVELAGVLLRGRDRASVHTTTTAMGWLRLCRFEAEALGLESNRAKGKMKLHNKKDVQKFNLEV